MKSKALGVDNKKFIYAVLLTAALVLSLFAAFAARFNASGEAAVRKSDIFVARNAITAIEENSALPAFSVPGSGVRISADGMIAEFAYKNEIDAAYLTKSRNAVSFQVLSDSASEWMTSIEFIFTDTADSNNYVSMHFSAPPDMPAEGYPYASAFARVGYRKTTRGVSELDSGIVWNGIYGWLLYGPRFCGFPYSDKAQLFSFQFDYASRSFYVNGGSGCVLDLRNPDHVGQTLWDGFKSGKATLSVVMRFSKPMSGGIIITELFGESLSGTMSEPDKKAPAISVSFEDDSYLVSPPPAAVGVDYRLPSAHAFDWYCGVTEPSVKIMKGGTDVSADISGGVFKPSSAGAHTIVYSAANAFGLTAQKEFEFTVLDKLPPFIFSFSENPQNPEILSNFRLPEMTVTGGSGNIALTEELLYNGVPVALGGQRSVFIDKKGFLTYKATAKGYTGEAVSRTWYFEVVDPDVALYVENIPLYLKRGSNTLPDFTAYTKSGNAAVKGITVDGAALNMSTRSFNITKAAGQTVQIVYTASDGGKSRSQTFTATVFQPSALSGYFMVEEGSATVTTSYTGTRVQTTVDKTHVALPFYLAADELALRFTIPANGGAFGRLEIRLDNPNIAGHRTTFAITPYNSAQSYLSIAGQNRFHPIPGSFGGSNEINIVIDVRKGEVFSNNRKVLEFEPWKTGAAALSFSFVNVTGTAAVSFYQISNQVFTTLSYILGDRTDPVLLTEKRMELYTETGIGGNITVPKAIALDVLDSNTKVSVEVLAPGGISVFSGAADTERSFLADKYGYYSIRYTFEDSSGNKDTNTFRIYVIDEIKPVLTVTGTVAQTAKLGSKIKIPQASATDNIDLNPFVSAYVFHAQSYNTDIAALGSDYTFTKAGTYKVVIYARDASYNMTEKVFTVEVK